MKLDSDIRKIVLEIRERQRRLFRAQRQIQNRINALNLISVEMFDVLWKERFGALPYKVFPALETGCFAATWSPSILLFEVDGSGMAENPYRWRESARRRKPSITIEEVLVLCDDFFEATHIKVDLYTPREWEESDGEDEEECEL